MGEAAERLWSPEEYLTWERQQPTKHEYVDGAIVAMPPANVVHNTIVANVIGHLGNALRGSRYRVLASQMRVKIHAKKR
jgi:Uma2 family endonuclease